jgi:hypothetical protein
MASDKSLVVMKSQRRKKIFAVEQFGGKCQRCGYDKCINALQFHHVDPSTKEYDPTYVIMRMSWESAYKELQKCILVCANCHAEIHYQDLDVSQILLASKTFSKICERCEALFETKAPEQKYCGVGCQSVSRRKVKIEPNKSDLQKLLDSNTPWTKIGEAYGVSDNAMRKWARKFELI